MSKTVAIIQSNYIPWKGYFDFINMVDEFILYDEVQYTRRDWRNRNQIKTVNGIRWMTIPVEVKGKYLQKINETKIATKDWTQQHCLMLTYNYSKSPYFRNLWSIFENVYFRCTQEDYLSRINFHFITAICNFLGINTKITWSTDYNLPYSDNKTARLVNLCKIVGATHYLSGPLANNYIEKNLFEDANINLSYIDYSNYPEYPQLFGAFTHNVTILDLIFNTGSNAPKYMKSFL